ncbi:Uncharacterized protein ChrSV_4326 [Chromobacterium vaccinii]|nr:Uncharacterized protein ChrSW_4326 [Chromobacterium vaccinii]QND91783.1 Uncharacterized protein ChrSV_4326 [Chromobacterium vaccinii]
MKLSIVQPWKAKDGCFQRRPPPIFRVLPACFFNLMTNDCQMALIRFDVFCEV